MVKELVVISGKGGTGNGKVNKTFRGRSPSLVKGVAYAPDFARMTLSNLPRQLTGNGLFPIPVAVP